MSTICDRCNKPMPGKSVLVIENDASKVEVKSWFVGDTFDLPDFCHACLFEIVKNGKVVEPEDFYEGKETA
jgi:hypothetical protein